MTTAQIKNLIDQTITNKTGQIKSITPALHGDLLKQVVDAYTEAVNAVGTIGNSNTGRIAALESAPSVASSSSFSYPKDETITEAQIGLLAMHKKQDNVYDGDIVITYSGGVIAGTSSGVFEVGDTINDGNGNTAEISFYHEEGSESLLFYTNLVGEFTPSTTLTATSGGSFYIIAAPATTLPENTTILLFDLESIIDLGDITNTAPNTLIVNNYNKNAILEIGKFLIVIDSNIEEIINMVIIDSIAFPTLISGGENATLCQTSPKVDGERLEFVLEVQGIVDVVRPQTKIVRIEFKGDNLQDDQTITMVEIGWGNLPMPIIFKTTPTEEYHVQIGATLSDTIDNLQAFLEDENIISNIFFKYSDRNGTTSIDIELLPFLGNSNINWNVGSNDGKPFAGYRIDTEISGDLGDDSSGGFCTYSVVRALSNVTLAEDIATMFGNGYANQNMVDFSSNDYFGSSFLNFLAIYTYGTAEEMGLVWFDTVEDFKDAVENALTSDSNFMTNYEILTTSTASSPYMAYITIREKRDFIQTTSYYFNTYLPNNAGLYITVNTSQNPTLTIPKMVRNMVLGEIVGVDGDNVLINSGAINTLKLASTNSGVNKSDVVVYAGNNTGLKLLFAWDEGKVVSLEYLYTQYSNQTVNSIVQWTSILNGIFDPFSTGNGNVIGKESVKGLRKQINSN